MRPYFKKKTSQERASGVAQGVSPEFKPQYWKKKKAILLKSRQSIGLLLMVRIEQQGLNGFVSLPETFEELDKTYEILQHKITGIGQQG
jgi:penicillin-binding protein-related factor A (putative recombinase)